MKSLSIYIIFITVGLSTSTKLPANFKRCKTNDDDCLNDAIRDAVAQLTVEGIPELNIPILDPIDVPSIQFRTNGSVVKVIQKYYRVKLYGFRQATVSNSHIDLDKKYITFTTKLPFLRFESDYDINGKILVLPIVGKGRSIFNMANVTVVHNVHFEEKTEKGNVYFKVKSYTFEISIQGLTFQLDNLFDGNKELSDSIHVVLNENWEAIWEETQRDFEEAFGTVLAHYSGRVFDNIPTKYIFL